MADTRASSAACTFRVTRGSASRATAGSRAHAEVVVGISACSNTCLQGQSRPMRSSRLFAVARGPSPHSSRDGAISSQSRWTHCSTACLTGSAGIGWSGLRSHWMLSKSGGAGRAMLRSGLVLCVGRSGNSWRARQSRALLRPSPTPHASYRTKEAGDGGGDGGSRDRHGGPG
jgi:hypothetical protein